MTMHGGEQPVDLAAVRADDALLDALGRGEPAPDDDDLAGLLAAWRTDLDTDPPALPTGTIDTLVPARRRGTGLRRVLVGAVAAAVILGGAAIGAGHSGPGSPLWPLTRIMYPQLVDVRQAEQAIHQARDAATAGRYADANGLLDVATGHAERVTDRPTRQRLLDQIDALRRTLPAGTGPATVPGPTTPSTAATPAPTAPAPTGPPPTTPAPATGGAQPPPGGNPLPGVKSLLPSLPEVPPLPLPTLPLPTLPLPPSLLPSLPVLGG